MNRRYSLKRDNTCIEFEQTTKQLYHRYLEAVLNVFKTFNLLEQIKKSKWVPWREQGTRTSQQSSTEVKLLEESTGQLKSPSEFGSLSIESHCRWSCQRREGSKGHRLRFTPLPFGPSDRLVIDSRYRGMRSESPSGDTGRGAGIIIFFG